MAVRAIRGAIQVGADDRDEILDAVSELMTAMLERNRLTADALISVVFTATRDLTAEFPAYAARRLGITDVPLLCAAEIDVPGAMPRVLRLLAHVETDLARDAVRHVYLGGAQALRTDLPPVSVDRVGIVGAGLIGTSVGLALARAGQQAVLLDRDPSRLAASVAMGAGRPGAELDGLAACDHVVVAVPPDQAVRVIEAVLRLDLDVTMSDVCSVKADLMVEVETLGPRASNVCGGHPIAGRERGGPGSAQAELFDHAVWAVTPHTFTSSAAADDVFALAERCGARPLTVGPDAHDRLLAAVSHAPQVVASLLAATLAGAGDLAPVLAGPGFRDTTRLADGDPQLWRSIAAGNAARLSAVLSALAERLGEVAEALRDGDAGPVERVLMDGRAGRALLPGKAAAPRKPDWARVGVVLADEPGALARLLTATAEVGVNVEDLTIEHAVDHPVGFVDLEVRATDVPVLLECLTASGWTAHRTS